MHTTNAADGLRALMKRAELTQEAFAKALGYSFASGISRYLDPAHYGDKPLPYAWAKRAAEVLRGRGSPPITDAEVLALSDLPETAAPGGVDLDMLALAASAIQGELKRIGGHLDPGDYGRAVAQVYDMLVARAKAPEQDAPLVAGTVVSMLRRGIRPA